MTAFPRQVLTHGAASVQSAPAPTTKSLQASEFQVFFVLVPLSAGYTEGDSNTAPCVKWAFSMGHC